MRLTGKLLPLMLAALCAASPAKADIKKDFNEIADSLSVIMEEKTTVQTKIQFKNIMKRGKNLDFYFTRETGDLPWRKGDEAWFRQELKKLFPSKYKSYDLGSIYINGLKINDLEMRELTSDGEPFSKRFRIKDENSDIKPLVRNLSRPEFDKGLSGRHIALWQSHGKYFNQDTGIWKWQRPCLFQTCEDMFTQGFVLPFLVPMLENSGAVTILPRERDWQRNEVIADNDTHYDSIPEANIQIEGFEDAVKTFGKVSFTGKWEKAGIGFADKKPILTGLYNPFTAGTCMKAECSSRDKNSAKAIWEMTVPQRGNYAVYISYQSIKNSSETALYTVEHAGGKTDFQVNQSIGGGTWIYLGTFLFDPEKPAKVTLTNKGKSNTWVTADAVRLGGGMGNVARYILPDKRHKQDTMIMEPLLSGLPRFAEGARYSMQWYGADTTVYSQNEQRQDYRDDFMSRGEWTKWLSGGSPVNPKYIPNHGLGIPLDLSFALHSDAGVFPNDSIVGTLAIYTLLRERSRKLPDGSDRMVCRELADIVQTQVVNDARHYHDPIWNRRGTWDRSYSESRTPAVPAMLLEFLSHQNFEDMKYGLDPRFRFTVARSIYKGMVKYLSNRYNREYIIQPLPVHDFATAFISPNEIHLSWKATSDELEPTADATYFRLYTRRGCAGFDNGRTIKASDIKKEVDASGTIVFSTVVPINAGEISSWKVTACNEGGESFPSEILSAGYPITDSASEKEIKTVVVINDFDRVGAPAWFDTESYAGFRNDIDSGVPYMADITFIGSQYQNERCDIWTDDFNPGFGNSDQRWAGRTVAGNTFDYPYVHGKSIMAAGYAFCSTSAKAFTSESLGNWSSCFAADIICGKQISTMAGNRDKSVRYQVWSDEFQKSLREFTAEGKHVLVSGANIGKDISSRVYPIQKDSTYTADTKAFASEVLGYKWLTGKGTISTTVVKTYDSAVKGSGFPAKVKFNGKVSESVYAVESADGIAPASSRAATICRYADTGVSAGISYDSGVWKTVCLGFPIETVLDSEARDAIIALSLKYFD